MNNKIIFSIVALLVLVSGTVFLLSSNSDDNSTNTSENISNSSTEVTTITESNEDSELDNQQKVDEVAVAGQYIDYNEQALASNSNDKRILFFHAPWCSTCNFFEGQIEDQGVPTDVTILKVDFDNDSATKQKYGVNVQSTFVLLDTNGEVVESWPFARGLTDIQDLYSQI